MPSPIGHVLAGLAVGLVTPPTPPPFADPRPRELRLAWLCVALAALPDLDLLYQPFHRTATHSVTAVIVVTIIAAGVTGWVTRTPAWRVGLVCGAAWASHLLLDWLGTDTNSPRGIQALWPFSDRWFISDWNVFPPTERREPLSMATMLTNAKAAAMEIGIMGSIAAGAWLAGKGRRDRQRRP